MAQTAPITDTEKNALTGELLNATVVEREFFLSLHNGDASTDVSRVALVHAGERLAEALLTFQLAAYPGFFGDDGEVA